MTFPDNMWKAFEVNYKEEMEYKKQQQQKQEEKKEEVKSQADIFNEVFGFFPQQAQNHTEQEWAKI